MKCQARTKTTGKRCTKSALTGCQNCEVHKGKRSSRRMSGGKHHHHHDDDKHSKKSHNMKRRSSSHKHRSSSKKHNNRRSSMKNHNNNRRSSKKHSGRRSAKHLKNQQTQKGGNHLFDYIKRISQRSAQDVKSYVNKTGNDLKSWYEQKMARRSQISRRTNSPAARRRYASQGSPSSSSRSSISPALTPRRF